MNACSTCHFGEELAYAAGPVYCNETHREMTDPTDCPEYDSDEHWQWCNVCEEHQHEDDHCCHLWWDYEVGWWAGPGWDDRGQSSRESFMRVLRATGMAQDVKEALDASSRDGLRYNMAHPIGGLGPGHHFLWLNGTYYGDKIGDLEDDDEHAGEYRNGVRWLYALAGGDCPDAVKLTRQWITEFLLGWTCALCGREHPMDHEGYHSLELGESLCVGCGDGLFARQVAASLSPLEWHKRIVYEMTRSRLTARWSDLGKLWSVKSA